MALLFHIKFIPKTAGSVCVWTEELSTQEEAVDVAHSTPQEPHNHSNVNNLKLMVVRVKPCILFHVRGGCDG